LPELGWAEVLLRVVLAAALGGAIGFERELREREAGLRTHMLVSVGAALFTLVSAYAWTDWRFSTPQGLVFDPTRIAAQVVSGIGFLGAGAIIRQGCLCAA
jgi:putative Mg2+ transporter-C (MgtC) family protein